MSEKTVMWKFGNNIQRSAVGNKPKRRISRRVFQKTGVLYVCVPGGKKRSFFGKFGVLCFLETPVLRFALLPYYRGSH